MYKCKMPVDFIYMHANLDSQHPKNPPICCVCRSYEVILMFWICLAKFHDTEAFQPQRLKASTKRNDQNSEK